MITDFGKKKKKAVTDIFHLKEVSYMLLPWYVWSEIWLKKCLFVWDGFSGLSKPHHSGFGGLPPLLHDSHKKSQRRCNKFSGCRPATSDKNTELLDLCFDSLQIRHQNTWTLHKCTWIGFLQKVTYKVFCAIPNSAHALRRNTQNSCD